MLVFILTTAVSLSLSLIAMWGSLRIEGRHDILAPFLWLDKTLNPGIAFGYRIPSPWQERLIFAALLLVIGAAYLEQESRGKQLAYGLITGGALSNIIDRSLDGFVTDIVHVAGFPAFNIADTCITAGVILLLFYIVADK